MARITDEYEELLNDLEQVRESGLANMMMPREVMEAAEELCLCNLADYLYDNRGALYDMLHDLAERVAI